MNVAAKEDLVALLGKSLDAQHRKKLAASRHEAMMDRFDRISFWMGFTEPLEVNGIRVGWTNPETKESIYI